MITIKKITKAQNVLNLKKERKKLFNINFLTVEIMF